METLEYTSEMATPELGSAAVALTGAAGLLGGMLLRGLSADGWRVIALDRVAPADMPNGSVFLPCDLARIETYPNLAQRIAGHAPRLKALINNAAYNPQIKDRGRDFESFENMGLNGWDRALRLNLSAPVFLAQALLDRFDHTDGRPCKIVNVTSIYGLVAPNLRLYQDGAATLGSPGVKPMVYPVTKAALDMATRYLGVYLAQRGFNVNAVAPGGIENGQPTAFQEGYGQLAPVGRMGRAEEMLGAFRFLLGEGSDYMCGHTLVVDGGWTVW